MTEQFTATASTFNFIVEVKKTKKNSVARSAQYLILYKIQRKKLPRILQNSKVNNELKTEVGLYYTYIYSDSL
jgi:hypothetical protein